MPVGVDDLLIIVAEEAGKALAGAVAKEVASKIVDFLFSKMATKEDLQRLAQQIEAIVHQEFLENRTDDMELKVSTVIHKLGQYKKSRDAGLVGQDLNSDLVDAYERIIQLADPRQRGDAVYHLEFVQIARYVGANTAYWMIRIYELHQSKLKHVFADELRKNIQLLEAAVVNVHAYEDETISPLTSHKVPGDWIETGNIPRGARIRDPSNSVASYTLTRRRYPEGAIKRTFKADGSGAQEALQGEYDRELARIGRENEERNKFIYQPAAMALDKMKALLASLPKS